jgi:hypothetical protein
MSPAKVCRSSPSRSATSRSCASCAGELSSTVTRAPAAANVGPCCPPPEARQRISSPFISSGNHSRGTGFCSVSSTDHTPRRAASMISGPTGLVHSFPRPTSLSHARR